MQVLLCAAKLRSMCGLGGSDARRRGAPPPRRRSACDRARRTAAGRRGCGGLRGRPCRGTRRTIRRLPKGLRRRLAESSSTSPAGTESATTNARSMSLEGNRLTSWAMGERRGAACSAARLTSSHATRPSMPSRSVTDRVHFADDADRVAVDGNGAGARGVQTVDRVRHGGDAGLLEPQRVGQHRPHVDRLVRVGGPQRHGDAVGLVRQAAGRTGHRAVDRVEFRRRALGPLPRAANLEQAHLSGAVAHVVRNRSHEARKQGRAKDRLFLHERAGPPRSVCLRTCPRAAWSPGPSNGDVIASCTPRPHKMSRITRRSFCGRVRPPPVPCDDGRVRLTDS